MIVHLCLTCGDISTNRIAGDDDPYAILKLLNTDANLDEDMVNQLSESNIHLLTMDNQPIVGMALFGNQYEQFIK